MIILLTDWPVNEPKLDRRNYKNKAYLTKKLQKIAIFWDVSAC
jgi:hypothetical protein